MSVNHHITMDTNPYSGVKELSMAMIEDGGGGGDGGDGGGGDDDDDHKRTLVKELNAHIRYFNSRAMPFHYHTAEFQSKFIELSQQLNALDNLTCVV